MQVIDFGVQPQREFKGQPKPPRNEIGVTYEFVDEFLPNEAGEDDVTKPRWQSENFPLYNIDVEKAKSTERYKALDGDVKFGGDWGRLLSVPCMVTLAHDKNKENPERPWINVASVTTMRPKDAAKCPALVNEPKFFDLDNPDVDVFNTFPDWIKNKIKDNLEYPGSKLQKLLDKGYKAPQDVPAKDVENIDDEVPW